MSSALLKEVYMRTPANVFALDLQIFVLLNMWLYTPFLLQFFLTITVRVDADFLFDDEASQGMDWSFSDVNSGATDSLFSSDGGDDYLSPVISESVPTDDQSLDWLANVGSPCVSDAVDFQTIGKFRAARRDGICRSRSSNTGQRKTGEDPLGAPSDSKIEIPNFFTAPTESNKLFYPSENQDECPSTVYGARTTPMCDSGYGNDFMKYSVLGFVALEMIEGCLPCTCAEPLPTLYLLMTVEELTRANQGVHFLAVLIQGWSGAASRTLYPTG